MSFFRTSRLLLAGRPALNLTLTYRIPCVFRHKSTTIEPKSLITRLSKSVATVLPEVDNELVADHGTSAYSPLPAPPRAHGPEDSLDASVFSGAPIDLKSRTVRIYKPAKTATQSGNWNGRQWRMDWDALGKGHRWENGLMGWQSSGDSMQGTHIFFKTKEDAIHFAEKQGYEWFVQEPNEREFRPKVYAANFYV
ncbi:ndufs4 NADH dehydrogenase Fe-S protein subunit [Maublancomyces gigas]|uniref:NADH dehydrogenase [ubiquinone] iron-sulfur protein 4, mitochondrial n=1 Tax=Discina gigas TaxID=1032678 RepID=A0ABR3G6H0_9PEZI